MLVVFALLVSTVPNLAQKPPPPKDWTPWAPVQSNWAEFLVIAVFRGGNKTPAQLAKKELKSLKVDCKIFGRLSKNLPTELEGVKSFRILYTEYGKFAGIEGFQEDSVEVPNWGNGQSFRRVTVTRQASEFDVREASKPLSATELTTTVPAFLNALGLGLDPSMEAKLEGHRYFVGAEWRRKGSTVELRVNDYRPPTHPSPSPTP